MTRIAALAMANTNHPDVATSLDAAKYVQGTVVPAMTAVRDAADQLERTSPTAWPLPKYSEILFIK